jgi:hypothetical protein
LSALLDLNRRGAGAEQIEDAVTQTQSGKQSGLVLIWRGRSMQVRHVKRTDVASLFGFSPNPESGIIQRQ